MNAWIEELKRRNVFRVGGVYFVVGWLLMQLSTQLEGSLNLPSWFDTFVTVMVMMGFPVALLLAWAFELTPEGVRPTPVVEGAVRKSSRFKLATTAVSLVGLLAMATGIAYLLPERPGVHEGTAIAPTAARATARENSIAVTPFSDLSPEGDQKWFADGIAEELLNALSQVPGLRVASRSSAFQFRERSVPMSEVADALNVGFVVEGSVRKAGERQLRVTAQLVDTGTDASLWSETYDRPLTTENIFAIQDEITRAIVAELAGAMELDAAPVRLPTRSDEAYELFLRAKDALAARTKAGTDAAITQLTRAVTLDPDFALAHAKLARAQMLAIDLSGVERDVAETRADFHIGRARELAPDNAEVLSDFAFTRARRDSLTELVAHFDAALARNPNNAEAHLGRASALARLGREGEALAAFDTAAGLDPLSVVTLTSLAEAQVAMDRRAEAKRTLERVLAIEPDRVRARGYYARILIDEADYREAHRMLMSADPEIEILYARGTLYTNLGMWAEGADVVGPVARAYQAIYEGREAEAREFAERIDPRFAFAQNYILWKLGEPERLREDYRTLLTLPAEAESVPVADLGFYNTILTLLGPEDPNFALGVERMQAHLAPFTPANAPTDIVRVAAAELAVIAGEPERAGPWLERAARGEEVMAFDTVAGLAKALGGTPEFKAFKARNAAIAARHASAIRADLESPPEPWWEPEG